MSDNPLKKLELTDTEKLAAYHFVLSNKLASSAVEHALITGEALIKVKLDTAHGQYEERLKLIGIPKSTSNKYVQLVKGSNVHVRGHLEGLNLAAMLEFFSASDEVKAEVTSKLENNEDVSGAEIKRLKLALEVVQKTAADTATREQEAIQHGKEFRQQFLNERNEKRELKGIIDVGLKPKTIYIANDEEAFKQLSEEKDRKFNNSEADAKKFHELYLTEKRNQVSKIAAGLKRVLDGHKNEIESKQQQETSIDGRIAYKLKGLEKLEELHGNRLEHKKALYDFRVAMTNANNAAGVLINNEAPHPSDIDQWQRELKKACASITYYQDHLETIRVADAANTLTIEKPD